MKTCDNAERLLREWGSCGFIFYDDKKPAGFVIYGPAKYFPNSGRYPAAPISKDALFISCLYIEPDSRGRGGGKRLINAVVKEALARDFEALEALAGRGEDRPPAVPVDYYLSRGFFIIRDDRRHPLVRLETKNTVVWREMAGEAIEKIAGARPVKAPAKAPVPL
jgi:GNAT superfamily N-acetyltransferase